MDFLEAPAENYLLTLWLSQGDLSTHPDHEAIVSFLRNYRVYPVCLQQGPLQDIGGILPLREEEKAENNACADTLFCYNNYTK